jgi:hypothetical protein
MTTLSDEELELLVAQTINQVKKTAESDKHRAALNGEWSDGGYAGIMRDIRFFTDGRAGTIPQEWRSVYNKLKSDYINTRELQRVQDDPEYKKFLELKDKFGHIK